jgi:hypothetical protein
MNDAPLPWSRRENRQVAVVGASPALAVALLAAILAPFVGHEVVFLAIAALPLAYGTLFVSVFPALSVLRRYRSETLGSFVATASSAAIAPWAALAGAYLLLTPPLEHPPGSLIVSVLATLFLVSALTATAAWLLAFRTQHAA